MEHLAFDDTQKLHQGIQKLYTFHNLDTFGVDALSIVNQLVPSDIPSFHLTRVRTRIRTHQISSIFLPDFPGYTPEMERTIDRHFDEHPILHHMPQTLTGAYQLSDFISRQELYCLEGVYQQFLRLLDVEEQMVFFLPHPNPVNWQQLSRTEANLVGFSLHRTWHNFTERDRLVLNLLRPHLFQAYCNAQQHHQLQQNLNQIQQSLDRLGVAIVNAQGRIQSIAPQAIIWLEIYFAKLTRCDRLPDHLWAWIEHQIAGFTNNPNLPKACLPLRIQQAGRELTIRLVVEQIGVRYLLLLEEQTLSALNSLAILGLSQRETEVLALVMQGKENKKIAAQLSIHNSTVRKHLENIYRKLGVGSRTEAISQAVAKLGFLYSLPLL
jgi:DNA-binding CsgD family transcriptional regulator